VSTAREAILGAIRASLAASRAHDRTAATVDHAPAASASPATPARAPLPVLGGATSAWAAASTTVPGDLAARFAAQLEAAGGHCTRVTPEAAAAAVAALLERAGARHVAVSSSPLAARLAAPRAARWTLVHAAEATRDALFACDAGVSAAQWGIAATGTIVLDAAVERSRLVSLVPPLHIALLRTRDLRPTLADVLALVAPAGGAPSHAVTLVTGPSRTSDIELTLAIGVHGPVELQVVLIDDDDPPHTPHDTLHPG